MIGKDKFSNLEEAIRIINGLSPIEQAMKSFESQQSLVDKALSITNGLSPIEQAMKSFESQQSLVDKALSITNGLSPIEQAMKSFESQQSLVDKALSITNGLSPIEQAMKSFESQQSLVEKALSITNGSSAIEQAMKSFESQQSLVEKALSITNGSSAIEQAMKFFDSQKHLTEKAMLVISGSSSVLDALEILQQSSVIKQIYPEFLNCVTGSINESSFTDYSPLNEETIESDLNGFCEVVKQLHPIIQLILIFFLDVIFSQLNSISANLLTPVVEDYLSQSDKTKRENIKNIKVLPRKISDFDTKSLRFITGNNVRLRAGASTSSVILDEMVFGQVVTIHSKNKNWIEISYEYEDGSFMQGWVFTRYTERFVK
ncbi:SH3 domain-containing protein [Colwellia sp. RE-S-Sl-9]